MIHMPGRLEEETEPADFVGVGPGRGVPGRVAGLTFVFAA